MIELVLDDFHNFGLGKKPDGLMSQKNLTLSLGCCGFCAYFRLTKLKISFNIDLAAFLQRLEVSVGAFLE